VRSGVIVGVGVSVSVDFVAGSTGDVWALRLHALRMVEVVISRTRLTQAMLFLLESTNLMIFHFEPITGHWSLQSNIFYEK